MKTRLWLFGSYLFTSMVLYYVCAVSQHSFNIMKWGEGEYNEVYLLYGLVQIILTVALVVGIWVDITENKS